MTGGGRTQTNPLRKRASAYDVRLGGRIALLRQARGVSRVELAKKLDVTPQQMQKYERGTNRVSASRLYEIALCLDVRIQYFFEDLGETSSPRADTSDSCVSAEDFLWLLAKLKDEELRWRVLRLIAELASGKD
ncbi:MAG: helix-turn-helix transcriptional regulator [Rhizomicrobium sp.]